MISVISFGLDVMAKRHAHTAWVTFLKLLLYIVSANTTAEFNLACEYARERKKRGKASKKEVAQQQALVAAASENAVSTADISSDEASPVEGRRSLQLGESRESLKETLMPPDSSAQLQRSSTVPNVPPSRPRVETQDARSHRSNSFTQAPDSAISTSTHGQIRRDSLQTPNTAFGASFSDINLNGYGHIHGNERVAIGQNLPNTQAIHPTSAQAHGQPGLLTPQNFQNFAEPGYGLMSSQDPGGGVNGFRFGNTSESPSAAFMGLSDSGSPGWLSLPSPSTASFNLQTRSATAIKYPVLLPLVPHIAHIIPQSLACDLLDLYFTSSSSAHLRPLSPYVLGYVLRKKSFLHPTKPRLCNPALLASMLWVAAQTSDAAFLTSPPTARGRVCQKLLEVTIGLLKPLIHGPTSGDTSPNYSADMVINGVALGGFGVSFDQLGAQSSATGAIDDVATYIHLATVVSASEYKAASLRWWNAAWSLARELKLGRELPPNPSRPSAPETEDDGDGFGEINMERDQHEDSHTQNPVSVETQGGPGMFSDEEREERRRIWWLLFTMDRHLALCYNRPLFLLDKECDGLLQPMNDTLWQAGDFANADYAIWPLNPTNPQYRRRGPSYECTGHSIFGYFLPLMTILGGIVDLHHARNHPRFGLTFRNADDWNLQAQEITQQLERYGESLKDFDAHFTATFSNALEHEGGDQGHNEAPTPSVKSGGTNRSQLTESIIQTKIAVAYGTHIMHVLHILLTGKWDPISLLDDNDLWISSQSFLGSTSHAVNAAEAVADILENDPDLSFMPFFFGMYLLQGSFLLLLIADKLQGEASPSVVKACETIVRAHEACVVTLNTEYQVRLLIIPLVYHPLTDGL